MARLFASVAPLVKMISSGSARDQDFDHDFSRSLDGLLRPLAVDVRAAPGVPKLLEEEGRIASKTRASSGVVEL